MKVYIVGAGPGDPKLLTIRALELIRTCPVILYTGSLVPKIVLEEARPDATVLDSAGMTLDQIMAVLEVAQSNNHDVARVHTGDPSIFGSTAEQMRRMRAIGIEYEIVPGVSSFTAAAAALGRELTLPEVTQTVIVTRAEGRTPMPPKERLAELGQHQATLVLFLSINLLAQIVEELSPHYGVDCPVAVVHRASWPDQQVLEGTLGDIRAKVKAARITSQSIVIVGRVLTCEDFADSRLYAADFHHGYRPFDRKAAKGTVDE
jgi:precorrin-4/cobalt-precorrin-4 C11-methyltransferase